MVKLQHTSIYDAPDIYRLVDRSREGLKRLQWAQTATLRSVETYIASHLTAPSIALPAKLFTIFADDNIVGLLELRDYHYHFQVGYWLDIHNRGRGYATKAVRKVLEMATKPVTAMIHPDNARSGNVLERAGFRMVSQDSEWNYYTTGRNVPS